MQMCKLANSIRISPRVCQQRVPTVVFLPLRISVDVCFWFDRPWSFLVCLRWFERNGYASIQWSPHLTCVPGLSCSHIAPERCFSCLAEFPQQEISVHPCMADEKLGHDGCPYTFDSFVQKYGVAGRSLWIDAPPALAGAPQPGYVATDWRRSADGQLQPWAEWRLASDGKPYTRAEFGEYYGSLKVVDHWHSAVVSFAGAPQPSILTEFRRGTNGCFYTWSDFVSFFGPSEGSTMWLAAERKNANVVQPGEPTPVLPDVALASQAPAAGSLSVNSALPPGLDSADGMQATTNAFHLADALSVGHDLGLADSTLAATPPPVAHNVVSLADDPAASASQSGVDFRRMWLDSAVSSIVLPHRSQQLLDSGLVFVRGDNLRDVINLAADRLYDYLPLPISVIASVDVEKELCLQDAVMVTAERVNRIYDHNRPPKLRVDIFAYLVSGEVVRYHPGRNRKADAQPHRMSFPSCLYCLEDALTRGVGQSLHVKPPGAVDFYGGASQPAVPVLLAQMHILDVNTYDKQMCGWTHFWKFVIGLNFNGSTEIDITAGEHYPWWLFLSSNGAIRDVIQHGVTRIRVSFYEGHRCIFVTNDRGDYRVFQHPVFKRIAVEEVV